MISALLAVLSARMAFGSWYSLIVVLIAVWTRYHKTGYGIVYNTVTLKPVPYAAVALIRTLDDSVVRSTISDESGRIRLLAPEGEFRMKASRADYVFPSKKNVRPTPLRAGQKTYSGSSFTVLPTKAPFELPDIPMEPAEPFPRPATVRAAILVKLFVATAKWALPVITLAAGIASGSPFFLILGTAEAAAISLSLVRWPEVTKNWGTIYNRITKLAVPYARIEVIETKFNKVIYVTIADIRGRYNFFVPNLHRYFIRVERPGYFPHTTRQRRTLILSGAQSALVGRDIYIEPDPISTPTQRGELGSAFDISQLLLEEINQESVESKQASPLTTDKSDTI